MAHQNSDVTMILHTQKWAELEHDATDLVLGRSRYPHPPSHMSCTHQCRATSNAAIVLCLRLAALPGPPCPVASRGCSLGGMLGPHLSCFLHAIPVKLSRQHDRDGVRHNDRKCEALAFGLLFRNVVTRAGFPNTAPLTTGTDQGMLPRLDMDSLGPRVAISAGMDELTSKHVGCP